MRRTLLALALLSAPPAIAQDWDCADADNLPQQGMNFCAHEDWQTADKALNAAWPKVRAHMKERDESTKSYMPDAATAEENLLKAQRAWIDYRDGHCEAESSMFAGGSMQPLILYSCMANMTRARTEELLQLTQEY